MAIRWCADTFSGLPQRGTQRDLEKDGRKRKPKVKIVKDLQV